MIWIDHALGSDTAYRLGWTLVHSLWLGVLVAIALAVVLAVTPKRYANVRYLLSCAAMLLLFVALGVTYALVPDQPTDDTLNADGLRFSPGMVVNATQLDLQPPPPADALPAKRGAEAIADAPHSPVATEASETVTVAFHRRATAWIGLRVVLLMPIWVAGVLFFSCYHLLGWLGTRRLRVAGTLAVRPEHTALMEDLAERLGIKRTVRLLQSTFAHAPMVIGWLKPVILVPCGALSELSAAQLEAILAHELAHIRRHDYLVNLVQVVTETLLFYHPAVWWVSRSIRQERECCCDDIAVQITGGRLNYAQALTAAVELGQVHRGLAVAADGGSLLMRIRRVLGHSPRASVRGAAWLAGLLAILICAVFTIGSVAHKAQNHATEDVIDESAEGGELGLRLISVRPDGSDEVFDRHGRSLGQQPEYWAGRTAWDADQMHREFIFEGPWPQEPVTLATFPGVQVSGVGRPLGGHINLWMQQAGDKARYVLWISCDRSYDTKWRRVDIEKLDLTLNYWQGPRGQGQYTFEGPFEEGKTIQASDGSSVFLACREYDGWYGTTFRLSTGLPFDRHNGTHFLAYDQSGQRRLITSASGRSGSHGATLDIRVPDLKPEEISAVTFGEPQKSITFKDVVVKYPNHPPRSYAPWLDDVAEALGVPNLPRRVKRWPEAAGVDALEALSVAHLVRGEGTYQLWYHLRSGDQKLPREFTGADLPAEQSEHLRALFMAWAEQQKVTTIDPIDSQPYMRASLALDLGLFFDYPEFVDPTLDMIEQGINFDNYSPLPERSLLHYGKPFTPEQLDRIERCILRMPNTYNRVYILPQLLRLDRGGGVHWDRLIRLAEDEQTPPWVWWRILGEWGGSVTHRLRDKTMSDRLIQRLVLAQNRTFKPPDRPELIEGSYALLPDIVADPRMRQLNHSDWADARRLLEKHLPRDIATEAQITQLKSIRDYSRNSWIAFDITNSINRLHNLNFGGIGQVERDGHMNQSNYDWQQIERDVIAWYESVSGE